MYLLLNVYVYRAEVIKCNLFGNKNNKIFGNAQFGALNVFRPLSFLEARLSNGLAGSALITRVKSGLKINVHFSVYVLFGLVSKIFSFAPYCIH